MTDDQPYVKPNKNIPIYLHRTHLLSFFLSLAFNTTSRSLPSLSLPPPPPSPDTTLPALSPPPPSDTNSTASSSPPPPAPSGISPGALAGLITGTGLGAIIVLIGVGIFVFLRRRKRRKEAERLGGGGGGLKDDPNTGLPISWRQQNPSPPTDHKVTVLPMPVSQYGLGPVAQEPPNVGSDEPLSSPAPTFALGLSQGTFTYEELSKATDFFSNVNLLGQGGFGHVYKGVLSNGKMVVVKKLKAESGQGEREFQAEIDTISHVHHRHLVSLVGYCIKGAQRLLVYEFVPNNTLEFDLHGKGRPTMDWATRMKIAIGSAKGLAYLHEDCHPKIIHRDIKAANILLDHSFEAKVSDFGLAKYFVDTETHVSTRVMGTFGYMAPEYASSGKLTEKSDVFSFGVVLLELVTGRRPVDRTQFFFDDSMVDWARPLLQQALEVGNYDALVDPKLQNDYDSGEMVRMIACAAACVRHSARLRPQMSQIIRALEGNMSLDDLNEGITPGHSRAYGSFGSSDYISGQYKEDLKNFRKLALESQELGSSEYSVIASDNGLQPSSSSTEGQQTTREMEKNVKNSKGGQETLQEEEIEIIVKDSEDGQETLQAEEKNVKDAHDSS